MGTPLRASNYNKKYIDEIAGESTKSKLILTINNNNSRLLTSHVDIINQKLNRYLGINCCHWSHEEGNGEGGFKQEIDEDISRVSFARNQSTQAP